MPWYTGILLAMAEFFAMHHVGGHSASSKLESMSTTYVRQDLVIVSPKMVLASVGLTAFLPITKTLCKLTKHTHLSHSGVELSIHSPTMVSVTFLGGFSKLVTMEPQ